MSRTPTKTTPNALTLTVLDSGAPQIVVSKLAVKALVTHSSGDETRQALNSVCFSYVSEKRTFHAVATDGHRLLSIDVTDAPSIAYDIDLLISRDALARISGTKGATSVRITWEGETVTMHAVSDFDRVLATSVVQRVDAQFPPYEQVLPAVNVNDTREPPKRVAVNCEYIGDVGTVAHAVGNGRHGGAVFQFGAHELDPILATCNGPAGSARVVVMPMRL